MSCIASRMFTRMSRVSIVFLEILGTYKNLSYVHQSVESTEVMKMLVCLSMVLVRLLLLGSAFYTRHIEDQKVEQKIYDHIWYAFCAIFKTCHQQPCSLSMPKLRVDTIMFLISQVLEPVMIAPPPGYQVPIRDIIRENILLFPETRLGKHGILGKCTLRISLQPEK